MKELHIRLYRENSSYHVDVIEQTGRNSFSRPPSGFPCRITGTAKLLREAQQQLLTALPGGDMQPWDALGQELFDMIHGPPSHRNALYRYWGECFEASRQSNGDGLRTILHFDSDKTADDLAAAPWELLCDSSAAAGYFASLPMGSPHTMARTRFGKGRFWRPPVPLEPDETLRVLIVLGHADNEDQKIRGTDEALQVDQGLFRLLPWQVDVRVLVRPTLDELRRAFIDWQPQVFHFVGHGVVSNNTTYLLIAQDDARTTPEEIDPGKLISLFGNQVPRLVVLNACRSGQDGGVGAAIQVVRGFTRDLIDNGVMAVIAMQADILGEAAVALMGSFYGYLTEGRLIDDALTAARGEVRLLMNNVGGVGNKPNQIWAWALPALHISKDYQIEQVIKLDKPKPEEKTLPKPMAIFTGVDQTILRQEGYWLAWPITVRTQVNSGSQMLAFQRSISHIADQGNPMSTICLLTGASGTGKTSLMFQLAEYCARRSQPFIYADCYVSDTLTFLDVLRLIRDGSRTRYGKGVQLAGSLKPLVDFNRFNYALNCRTIQDYATKNPNPPALGVAEPDLAPAQITISSLVPLRSDESPLEVLGQMFWEDLVRAAGDQLLVLFLDHLHPAMTKTDVDLLMKHLVVPAKAAGSKVRVTLCFKDVTLIDNLGGSSWQALIGEHRVSIQEHKFDELPIAKVPWLARIWARRYFVYSRELLSQHGLHQLAVLLKTKQVNEQQVEAFTIDRVRGFGATRNVSPDELVKRLTLDAEIKTWLTGL
jgi:hypothetical protein